MEQARRSGHSRLVYDKATRTIAPVAGTPKVPGFYWAKWRIADEGTADDGEPCRGAKADWEVVDVFKNCLDEKDDEYLMVAVPGVEKSQSLENFFWGPGPLGPPAT